VPTIVGLRLYQSHLISRIAKVLDDTGPLIDVEANDEIATTALRLVRGSMMKIFRTRSISATT
jgi:hypothetical protein